MIDIRRMDYDAALGQLQRVESDFPGTSAAKRAKREREGLQREMRREKITRDGS